VALLAALVLAPATAQAQFMRGGFMPVPRIGFGWPFGLPYVAPAYSPYAYNPYTYGAYPGTDAIYQARDALNQNLSAVMPARTQRPATNGGLPGRPHMKIEEFDTTKPTTPAAGDLPDKETPAHLEVRVPAGAEVWFDGKKSTETGTVRQFDTGPLLPGVNTSFEVRVHVKGAAQDTDDIRHVNLRAGERRTLDVMTRAEGAPTEKR
jgi:uncharacterized protein (TIGR03000 family)